jgi:hypothetical protein
LHGASDQVRSTLSARITRDRYALPEIIMSDHTAPDAWRSILASSINWKQAHATFDDAVADFPAELRGCRPDHFPHSAWELVEHIRLAQADLISFMRDASYSAPRWPDDYWPSSQGPRDSSEWDSSIANVKRDRTELEATATDPALDLTSTIPWSEGRTYLRTILVATDHMSYHVGQLIAVRQLLGAWPAA